VQYQNANNGAIDFPCQVYCDMDGVLVDFEYSAIDKINETLKDPTHTLTHLSEIVIQELGRDYIILTDLKKGKYLSSSIAVRNLMQPLLEDDEEWWANLPFLEEGKKIWSIISKLEPKPIILTSPMNQNEKKGSIEGKKRWIKTNLELSTNVEVIFSHDKYEYAVKDGKAAILIDDFEKNIRLFKQHGGHIIHHVNSAKDSLNILAALGEQRNEHMG
jgi:5'(3')-deoxyribonucleotidase